MQQEGFGHRKMLKVSTEIECDKCGEYFDSRELMDIADEYYLVISFRAAAQIAGWVTGVITPDDLSWRKDYCPKCREKI